MVEEVREVEGWGWGGGGGGGWGWGATGVGVVSHSCLLSSRSICRRGPYPAGSGPPDLSIGSVNASALGTITRRTPPLRIPRTASSIPAIASPCASPERKTEIDFELGAHELESGGSRRDI